jgi:hypothetical protein
MLAISVPQISREANHAIGVAVGGARVDGERVVEHDVACFIVRHHPAAAVGIPGLNSPASRDSMPATPIWYNRQLSQLATHSS